MKTMTSCRKIGFVAALVASMTALAGFGDSRRSVQPDPLPRGGAALPRAKDAPPIRVACIGDSITSGYLLKNPASDAYPAQLGRLLGSGYEVRNFGLPGLGVYLHAKRQGTSRGWAASSACSDALAWKPDIVVCNLGINDSADYQMESQTDALGRSLVPPGTFRRQYIELLDAFRTNGVTSRIVMWTRLGALGSRHHLYGSPLPGRMEGDLERVAAAVGADRLDMYTPLKPYVETDMPDGIHPSPAAAGVIAEATREIIQARR